MLITPGVQLQSGVEAEVSFRLLHEGQGRGEGLTVHSNAWQRIGLSQNYFCEEIQKTYYRDSVSSRDDQVLPWHQWSLIS